MIRYSHTHGFDELWAFACVMLSIFFLAALAFTVGGPHEGATKSGFSTPAFWVLAVLGSIACFAFWCFVVGRIRTARIPTYLYLRITLRTPISWNQARQVHLLFSGELGGRWLPLKALLDLPMEARVRAVLQIADLVRANPDYLLKHDPIDDLTRFGRNWGRSPKHEADRAGQAD